MREASHVQKIETDLASKLLKCFISKKENETKQVLSATGLILCFRPCLCAHAFSLNCTLKIVNKKFGVLNSGFF